MGISILEDHAKEAREKAREVAREEAEHINLNISNILLILEKLLVNAQGSPKSFSPLRVLVIRVFTSIIYKDYFGIIRI